MPILTITDNIFAVFEIFIFLIFGIDTFAPYDLLTALHPLPTHAGGKDLNKYTNYVYYVACKRINVRTCGITHQKGNERLKRKQSL